MYAIITTGGKQVKVELGARCRIERLSEDVDSAVNFEDVLLVHDGTKATIGSPYVAKAVVEAVVVDQIKGPKIKIIKMRRRKHSMTKTGHRQYYTWVRFVAIKVDGKVVGEVERNVAPKIMPSKNIKKKVNKNVVDKKVKTNKLDSEAQF